MSTVFNNCLEKAKIVHFEKGLIAKEFIENLTLGKEIRESADYRASFSKEGAESLIKAADDFMNTAKKLRKK